MSTSLFPSGSTWEGWGLRLPSQGPSDGWADGASGCGWTLRIWSREVTCSTQGQEQDGQISDCVCCHEGPQEARLSSCVRSLVTEKTVLSLHPHLAFFPRLGGREGFAKTTAPCPLIQHHTCPSDQDTSSFSLNGSSPPGGLPDYSRRRKLLFTLVASLGSQPYTFVLLL